MHNTLTVDYFDAKKITASGQVFRMYETDPGCFDIYSADRHLRLYQAPSDNAGACNALLRLDCPDKDLPYWRRYLDLDRDYRAVTDLLDGKDGYLNDCCRSGWGIRILRQDTWEMMISFIISQQKQIPSIRRCIEGLCAKLGTRMEEWYAFPTAAQIAEAGPDGVKGLSLGYRERYIYETALQYLDHGITDEELAVMPYDEAKKYLLSFTGIGEKVANCILLFGAGFVDAFPIDTHIKDILYREYYLPNLAGQAPVPQEKLTMSDYERLTEQHFSRYRGYRGIVQQWIFANEVNNR